MSFYNTFLRIMIFLMHFRELTPIGNSDLVVTKTGVDTVSPCSAGLVFFVEVNNTSAEDLELEVLPDQCCVDLNSEENCDVVEMVGDCVESVPKGTLKTVTMVAPLTDSFERRGYCIVYLDSKPQNRQRGTMRDSVKIPFDTRLNKNTKQAMDVPVNVTMCKRIDEDPLNDCKPVDCESYYNGKRSYYDNKAKRCLEVPVCVPDTEDEIPNVVLDLNKNRCILGKSITSNDLNMIKELTSHKERKPKDILIIKNLNKNPIPAYNYTFTELHKIPQPSSKMPQSSDFIKKDYELKFDPSRLEKKLEKIKDTGMKFIMAKYYISNKWTIIVFGAIILIQCCLICTMVYFLTKKCGDCRKKKVIRRFFNYRQDASVTTPLICTSNIDTETTEFQYFSESSNIDNKIKCYKACQERKNNVKMSMSDDILSKCLTRRDWSSKPAKSEAIPELAVAEDNKLVKHKTLESVAHESLHQNAMPSRMQSSAKVNFENELPQKSKHEMKHRIVKSIVKKMDSRLKREKDYDVMQGEQSERELKCHSYNYSYLDGNSNLSGFKPSTHSKKLGIFRMDKRRKGTIPSIERGAQAAFSNDSLDDFLSERGLLFLADEDLSKYSFSSRSNEAKPSSVSSEVSSKTSKNNIVKNVLSLLQRKSRHGPSSDPGAKKQSNLDVELIHMSHASVYSSNIESDYLKSMKMAKDSRSSL